MPWQLGMHYSNLTKSHRLLLISFMKYFMKFSYGLQPSLLCKERKNYIAGKLLISFYKVSFGGKETVRIYCQLRRQVLAGKHSLHFPNQTYKIWATFARAKPNLLAGNCVRGNYHLVLSFHTPCTPSLKLSFSQGQLGTLIVDLMYLKGTRWWTLYYRGCTVCMALVLVRA